MEAHEAVESLGISPLQDLGAKHFNRLFFFVPLNFQEIYFILRLLSNAFRIVG